MQPNIRPSPDGLLTDLTVKIEMTTFTCYTQINKQGGKQGESIL